ncbi:hypothetical protein BGZ65_001465, partial [Modicella reniformis]
DYVRHKLPCKHMYLVPRIYGELEVEYNTDLGGNPETVELDEPLGPPLENTLSQNVLLQLQAMRTENKEAKKREREAANAEVFRQGENDLRGHVEEAGRSRE